MLTYKIEYTNLFDETVEDVVRFHLTNDEMLAFLKEHRDSLYGSLQAAEDADYLAGYEFVRNIVVMAYGERSDDGKRFLKSDDIRANLTQSPLIDAVMETIFKDEKTAQAFIDGVFPPKMREIMASKLEEESKAGNGGKSKK